MITDKPFNVNDKCIKCGICADVCPTVTLSEEKEVVRNGGIIIAVHAVWLAITTAQYMPSIMANEQKNVDNIISRNTHKIYKLNMKRKLFILISSLLSSVCYSAKMFPE